MSFYTEAQDSTAFPRKFTINGYIKTLQTLNFNKDFSDLVSDNLLHNRINLKWQPSSKVSYVLEFRNRMFWGEEVKITPGFASLLKNENEKLNLQKVWIDQKSLVLLSNIERMYSDFKVNKLNVRIGRQRINWGMTTTWNPNDLFNSYNFLDFDYEERSGVDGGIINYFHNDQFNTELAFAKTGMENGDIVALKYNLNKWNYDFQLITGWYNQHATLGTGWAGSIKDAGFKGEFQYYFTDKESTGHLNLSMEGDYMFKNDWYINLGLLLNSRGLDQPITDLNALNIKISPENLMPSQWNFMLTIAKELYPLFTSNVSLIYAPGTNQLIIYPTFQYNLAANLDVNLIWQSYFAELNGSFQAINHQCFLRLKLSY